jgi:hypothetical protein
MGCEKMKKEDDSGKRLSELGNNKGVICYGR